MANEIPMPWQLATGNGQVSNCSAFLNSDETCDMSSTGECHASESFLLFGDPDDSHNPKLCATHYFGGLGDGTQFDDYWLIAAPRKEQTNGAQ